MAISVRYFLIEEDGTLKHVPLRVRDGLGTDEDALPTYAGTRQRVAEVILDNEAGKPVRIMDVRGVWWAFDEDGHLDHADRAQFMRMLDPLRDDKRGRVVDLRPDIEKREWKKRNNWEITHDDLDRITAAVWPWAVDRAQDAVETVKGKAKKEPRLTRDGRDLLVEIGMRISEISSKLDGLSEPALKGLAHALRGQGLLYRTLQDLYDGFAQEADRAREIKTRHRTGRGGWVALLEVWRWTPDGGEGNVIDTIEERHQSRPDAVAAARRLLAEQAHRFDMGLTVEAKVVSDLEWTPIDHPRCALGEEK